MQDEIYAVMKRRGGVLNRSDIEYGMAHTYGLAPTRDQIKTALANLLEAGLIVPGIEYDGSLELHGHEVV